MNYSWLDVGTTHTSACTFIHWLLDGKRKINVGSNHNKIADNVFEFPDLRIISFDMIGNYKCVIENEDIEGEKVVSKKALFSNLKGNSPTFSFKLSRIFLILSIIIDQSWKIFTKIIKFTLIYFSIELLSL